MVSFNCDACNDTVKKPKLQQHFQRCGGSFTCIDCSSTFTTPNDWKSHTSCISEAEKYQKGLYKGPKHEPNGKQTNGKKGKTLGTRPAAEPALSGHAPAVTDGLYTSAAPAADDVAPAAEDTGPAAEDIGLAAEDTADGLVAEDTAPGTEAASVKEKKGKKGKKKSKATESDAHAAVSRPAEATPAAGGETITSVHPGAEGASAPAKEKKDQKKKKKAKIAATDADVTVASTSASANEAIPTTAPAPTDNSEMDVDSTHLPTLPDASSVPATIADAAAPKAKKSKKAKAKAAPEAAVPTLTSADDSAMYVDTTSIPATIDASAAPPSITGATAPKAKKPKKAKAAPAAAPVPLSPRPLAELAASSSLSGPATTDVFPDAEADAPAPLADGERRKKRKKAQAPDPLTDTITAMPAEVLPPPQRDAMGAGASVPALLAGDAAPPVDTTESVLVGDAAAGEAKKKREKRAKDAAAGAPADPLVTRDPAAVPAVPAVDEDAEAPKKKKRKTSKPGVSDADREEIRKLASDAKAEGER